MDKKKSTNKKRGDLPKQVAYTSEFKKSWERYDRVGRRDMNEALITL